MSDNAKKTTTPLTDVSAEVKLYVKEQAEKARNQAIGILSFVAGLVGLLTALGIYLPAKTFVQHALQEQLETQGNKAMQQSISDAHKDSIEALRQIQDNATEAIKQKRILLDAIGSTARIESDIFSDLEFFSPNTPEVRDVIFSRPFSETPILLTSRDRIDGFAIEIVDKSHFRFRYKSKEFTEKVVFTWVAIGK